MPVQADKFVLQAFVEPYAVPPRQRVIARACDHQFVGLERCHVESEGRGALGKHTHIGQPVDDGPRGVAAELFFDLDPDVRMLLKKSG